MAQAKQDAAQIPGFDGAIGNREAEQAVLYVLVVAKDADSVELLEKLGTRDFNWQDTRWVFGELQRMRLAGSPWNDEAGRSSWFRQPAVLERMAGAGLADWKDNCGKLNPFALIYSIAIDGQFGSMAYAGWYIEELRRWRKVRGLRLLAHETMRRIIETPAAPDEVITWIAKQVQKLSECKNDDK